MEMSLVKEDHYELMWNRWRDNRHTIDEISRGHGKTEFGIWVTLWNIIRQPINPWWDLGGIKRVIQQLIVSSSWDDVAEMGDRIENYVFANPIFEQFVPTGIKKDSTSKRWNQRKKGFTNGSTLHFRPVKSKRGLHVDHIWMDDLITESSTLKDAETRKFVESAIMPMGGQKRAMLRLTGTPLRATDIIHVMEKTGEYDHFKLPAVLNWEQKIISSKRMTWATLMTEKRKMHPASWEAEYMLNPLEGQNTCIKRPWVEKSYDRRFGLLNIHKINAKEAKLAESGEAFVPWSEEYYAIYGGIDFAFSDRITADWSAYYTIGDRGDPEDDEAHDMPRFDLLGCKLMHGKSIGEQTTFMQEWHELWDHDLIGVEANSIMGSMKDLRRLALPLKMFWTGNKDEMEKLKPQVEHIGRVHSISKRNFVLRLGTLFEQGNIRVPYQGEIAKQIAERLTNECVSWALEDGKIVEVGVHPDMPIALGFALEVALGHNFAVG